MKYLLLLLLVYFKDTIFVVFFSPLMYLYYKKKEVQLYISCESNTKEKQLLANNARNYKKRLKAYFACFASFFLYKLAYIPAHRLRNFVYKRICRMNIKEKVVIYYGAEVRNPEKIIIGKGSIIGDNAILDGRNGIVIGENVVLASNVRIWTEQHDHRDPWFRCETQEHKPVIIDDRAWIGSNCTILHSVHIGEGAVVASGAVVTHDVPPFTIVAGIPARQIAKRNKDLKYIFQGNHRHFL